MLYFAITLSSLVLAPSLSEDFCHYLICTFGGVFGDRIRTHVVE